MSARKWVLAALMAGLLGPAWAGQSYTLQGDNSAEIARYQQLRPAAVESLQRQRELMAQAQRAAGNGSTLRTLLTQGRELEKSAEKFGGMFSGTGLGRCGASAVSLREYISVLLGNVPATTPAEQRQGLSAALAACKTQIAQPPARQRYFRSAANVVAPPGPGCLEVVSPGSSQFKDWSCPH